MDNLPLFEVTDSELSTQGVIGFSGTQYGLTEPQKHQIAGYLQLLQPREVHHGDCVGADAQFHSLVREMLPDARIVIHPPLNDGKRAFCDGDETKEARAYLTRNRRIVRESEILLAAPQAPEEVLRSGTWATIRFARKRSRPIILVLPDTS